MEAAIGNTKDYTLKNYLVFVKRLQAKSEVGLYLLLLNSYLYMVCIIVCSVIYSKLFDFRYSLTSFCSLNLKMNR